MGRSPCCDETTGLKKGPWSPEEDQKLIQYVQKHGHGSWKALPKLAGLNRCGKSCRLRWTNYLRPDIKRGKFSPEEEQIIVRLHSIMGNKWSAIATHLPGRTDNEIKNFWNTHLKKKLLQMGIDPATHQPRTDLLATLPQLLALASLGDIIAGQPWSDHVARMQAEASKLLKQHCFQYLLQSSETINVNLISGVSSKLEALALLHATLPDALAPMSTPGILPSVSSHQVALQDYPEMPHRLDQAPFGSNMRQDSACDIFGAEGSSEFRASLISHPSISHTCDGSLLSLDACSASSCDGSFNSSFWPGQLMAEDTLM